MRTLSLSGAALVFLAACGGGAGNSPPVASPSTSAAPAAPSALPASSASPAPAASGSAKPVDETSDAAHAAPTNPDAAAAHETKPREKLYRMTPHGLVVEMTGVEFRTRAKAVRRGAGWGVKVSVEAKSKDGQSHVLLAPAHGPLAFSVKVDRGGKVEEVGDTRKGDKLETVDQGKPLKLSRTWPDTGTRPVTRGQSLDLQVGLWGLGADADSQRPVRQFVEVKMVVGKGKPQAVVSPPASAK